MGMDVTVDIVYGINVDGQAAKTLFPKLNYNDDGICELIPKNDKDAEKDRYCTYIRQVDGRGNDFYFNWEWFTAGILLATNWDEEKIEQYLTPQSINRAKRLWDKYFLPLTKKQPHILIVGIYS